MSKDILAILQERKAKFSKGQRLIAKYITESYDKAAFMVRRLRSENHSCQPKR